MGFYHDKEIGTFHLNEVPPPRVVPAHEKHKWDKKITWGGQATCVKCGCVKRMPEWNEEKPETYQLPGGPLLLARPACGSAVVALEPTVTDILVDAVYLDCAGELTITRIAHGKVYYQQWLHRPVMNRFRQWEPSKTLHTYVVGLDRAQLYVDKKYWTPKPLEAP